MINGKYAKLLLIIPFMMLITSCSLLKQTVYVPVYTEVPIVHPNQYNDFKLHSPNIEVVNKQLLQDKMKNLHESDILYILNEQSMQQMLEDDLAKLEYLQYETMRANYYKTYIDDYNSRIKELNKNK